MNNGSLMKTSPLSLKPCCKKFQKISVQYLDIAIIEDDTLQLIISLLSRLKEYHPIEAEEARKLADFLDGYLNLKIVREHYFFGRSLKSCNLEASDLRAEISRIDEKLRSK